MYSAQINITLKTDLKIMDMWLVKKWISNSGYLAD